MSLTHIRFGIPLKHIRACRRALNFHKRNMCSLPETDDLLAEKVGNKGIFTMNRPAKLNALTLPMIRKMYAQLTKWIADQSVSMIIIKGAGHKSFCCGGDVLTITDAAKVNDPLCNDYFREEYTLQYTIGNLKIPWVAFQDGVTMGAGVGLSVHGMFRVATEKTLFSMPETALGLFVDVGGGYFMPRLAGKLGIYLGLTGARLTGRDVQRVGIATHFVQSSKIDSLEADLMLLKDTSPESVSNLLNNYHNQCDIELDKEFALNPHIDKINELFSGETVEDILRNLEQEGSEWSQQQIETLRKMSPTSMKITLRHLQLGATNGLADSFIREYRMSQRSILDNDFFEGSRAILVDKDNNPRWKPATLEEVTQEHVDWYFSELPDERELKLT